MRRRAIAILGLLAALLPLDAGWATQLMTRTAFGITGVQINCPVSYFALFEDQRGRKIAIKIEVVRPGQREGIGEADYIAVDLTRAGRLRVRRGTLSDLGYVGVHPLVFQRGRPRVRVFGIRLNYQFPDGFSFVNRPYRFAATPWTRVEEIVASHPCLKWYQADESSELQLDVYPDALISGECAGSGPNREPGE